MLEEKIAGYSVKLPCVEDVGSCDYDNFCIEWAEMCPKYFGKFGLPCSCPFPAGNYSVTNAVVPRAPKLPLHGLINLRLTGTFLSPSKGYLGCFRLAFSVNYTKIINV